MLAQTNALNEKQLQDLVNYCFRVTLKVTARRNQWELKEAETAFAASRSPALTRLLMDSAKSLFHESFHASTLNVDVARIYYFHGCEEQSSNLQKLSREMRDEFDNGNTRLFNRIKLLLKDETLRQVRPPYPNDGRLRRRSNPLESHPHLLLVPSPATTRLSLLCRRFLESSGSRRPPRHAPTRAQHSPP